jgi:hypothetical protein
MQTVSSAEATAEVFFTAFHALSKKAQQAFMAKLLQNKEFYEDIVDSSIIEQRRSEPSRSLESYLAERAKSK